MTGGGADWAGRLPWLVPEVGRAGRVMPWHPAVNEGGARPQHHRSCPRHAM